jgi:hypothetical protein
VEAANIERSSAGPFVTVLTISGAVEDGAERALREQLAVPGLESQKVVVDLTEAMLFVSPPFPFLAKEAQRFGGHGGRLVVVSGDNLRVKPFPQDWPATGPEWFASLDHAMVELLGDVASLGEGPQENSS